MKHIRRVALSIITITQIGSSFGTELSIRKNDIEDLAIVPSEQPHLQNDEKLLENSAFIRAVFEKCKERGYEFKITPENNSRKVTSIKIKDLSTLRDEEINALQETLNSLKDGFSTYPTDPFAIFLGCLFSREHEEMALSLLKKNPEWAEKKLTWYFKERKWPDDILKRQKHSENDYTILRKENDVYDYDQRLSYLSYRNEYLWDYAIYFDQKKILKFLIGSINSHTFYTKHEIGRIDNFNSISKSIFQTILDQYPWEILENPSYYNVKFKDFASTTSTSNSNEGILYLALSSKVTNEDFQPTGRGYHLTIKLAVSYLRNRFYTNCAFTYASSIAQERDLIELSKMLNSINNFSLYHLLPLENCRAYSFQDENSYLDVTSFDSNLLRECLKETDYNPIFSKKVIDVISESVQRYTLKTQEEIKKLNLEYDLKYFMHLIETSANKELKTFQSMADFYKSYQELIDKLENEKKVFQEKADSLIKVYEERPNLATLTVNSLKKKLLNIGKWGDKSDTFENAETYFSMVSLFLNAHDDALEIPNDFVPKDDIYGVKISIDDTIIRQDATTRILWDQVNSGTRNQETTPKEFIISIWDVLDPNNRYNHYY